MCQRKGKIGSVKKVLLGSMPLIDTPFKRVEVDIIGPIPPLYETGHQYILTLVDYATRNPEAVSLKKITTEAVGTALLNIYSRVVEWIGAVVKRRARDLRVVSSSLTILIH